VRIRTPGLFSRDFIELLIGYALILVAIWTPPSIQRYVLWLTFSWILTTTLLARHSPEALGFGIAGLRRSAWVLAAALILASVQVLVAIETRTLHTLTGPMPVGEHMWGYAIWAFLQQFVLQDFFLFRLLRMIPNRSTAVFTAAVLFSVAHLPNPILTVVTLLWGWAACAIFLEYRSLLALGVLHALLGLSFAVTVPGNLHRHMRVGLGYLRYRAEPEAHADAARGRGEVLPTSTDGRLSPALERQ